MKKVVLFLAAALVLIGLYTYFNSQNVNFSNTIIPSKPSNNQSQQDIPTGRITVIAENLDTPWAIAILPNKSLLVTERFGKVVLIGSDEKLEDVATLSNVEEIGEGGLLGITLHPNFSSNNYVYLYYTYQGNGNDTLNRVVRMIYKDKKLSYEKIIVDKIPGASNHNGGRIKFGPDNLLYIATGDAQNPSQSQDKNSLAGKILRVTDEGQAAQGNPFNNLVYSYGHRNPQGITWDENGKLWETEHGQSATDELNLIEPGKNYGWPTTRGNETRSGLTSPIVQSKEDTWAPGGVAYFNGSVYFAGLRGQALYQAVISGNSANIKTHLKGEFGRIRDVVLGPDNMLYITTSNRDGRGSPADMDDRVIQLDPNKL